LREQCSIGEVFRFTQEVADRSPLAFVTIDQYPETLGEPVSRPLDKLIILATLGHSRGVLLRSSTPSTKAYITTRQLRQQSCGDFSEGDTVLGPCMVGGQT
jgi:hypothetical protein